MRVEYILLFLISLILTLLLTPWVIKFAHKIGAIDEPTARKVHQNSITRLGGLAIFISILSSVLVSFFLFPELFGSVIHSPVQIFISVSCFISIFILGFIDDVKSLRTGIKFGVQFLVAALIYYAGFRISNITNPLGVGVLSVELLDFPLTVLWIVGITNAFNLIDGLDGLASGISVIACTSIFVVSVNSGYVLPAVFSLIIMGSMIGFLRYNFYPAKIFLGDSGSLFIGFCLAFLSIESATKVATGFSVLFPLLVLALPITDTIISMLRRFLGSYLDQNSNVNSKSLSDRISGMFNPDRSHIHHQLLSRGLTHRNSVIVLYAVSGFFAVGAFAYTQVQTVEMFINISFVLGIALLLGIKKLRYHEIAVFNNGLILSFYKKWILNQSAVIVLADLIFIAAAYSLSYSLIQNLNTESVGYLSFANTLIIILTIQSITYWLSGIYKERMDHFSLGNALHITAGVGYSILATGVAFTVMNPIPVWVLLQLLILNFYLLITFTLGFRIVYQISKFLYERNKITEENILIYGAGVNGELMLQKIIHSPDNSIKVLGFLDDNCELKGKIVYGYPILGGHWELEKKELNEKVDSIYLCEDKIKPENLKRLKKMAYQKNISLKKLQLYIQEMDNPPNVEPEPVSEIADTTVSSL